MSIDKFKEVSNRIQQVNDEVKRFARDKGGAAFRNAFQVLFDMSPSLVQIKWSQYTPYFSDGDVCEFGVNEPGFYIESDDLSESHYEHELTRRYDEEQSAKNPWAKRYNDRYDALGGKEFLNAKTDLWKSIPKELFLAVFGDHVEVTVTRDGITTEEYSHD